jgi:hypothetical protein
MGTHIGTRMGMLVLFLQLHGVLASMVTDPSENAEEVTVLSELAGEPVIFPCSTHSAWIRYFRWRAPRVSAQPLGNSWPE